MNRILTLAAAAVTAVVLLAPQPAQAYCVYNYTDGWSFRLIQRSNGGYMGTIGSAKGDRSCCNWEDSVCNRNGARTAGVTLDLYGGKQDTSYTGGYKGLTGSCGYSTSVELQAGGWVDIYPGDSNTVSGDAQRKFHCIAYGVDGQVTGVWKP